ncbi:MAG: hypothetical protein N2556_04205 [Anaerolineae bacterium]|nr:hypothetical protein [Anaerolineae bacterium]
MTRGVTKGHFLVFRRRPHTRAVRFRDYVGVIIADKRCLPMSREARKRYGISNVDWWYDRSSLV